MAIDLSKYNLNNADEYVAAAGEVAEHTADALGDNFSRREGDELFINIKAVQECSTAATLSGLLLMVSGDRKASAEVLKLAVSINAIVDEVKVRESDR